MRYPLCQTCLHIPHQECDLLRGTCVHTGVLTDSACTRDPLLQHTLICKLKAVYFGDGGGVENLLKTKQMSFNIHNLKIISKKTKDK